jgi:hypothetical protein
MSEFVAVDAVEAVGRELTTFGVRYLVVGGLALHAYGGDRVTYDIDLVIQLEPANVIRAFEALARASYRPLVPVQAVQFADATKREQMIREKGMIVLQACPNVDGSDADNCMNQMHKTGLQRC